MEIPAIKVEAAMLNQRLRRFLPAQEPRKNGRMIVRIVRGNWSVPAILFEVPSTFIVASGA